LKNFRGNADWSAERDESVQSYCPWSRVGRTSRRALGNEKAW
jgi:hypothetical protein